jgi:hypothetical protein
MLVTNHVLSGAVIGAALRRPLPAFALGVASHFALDAAPHWGRWSSNRAFYRVAVADGLTGLAAMAVLTRQASPPHRPPTRLTAAVVAGMAGAALPDLDKPAALFLGHSLWPASVKTLHQRIQNEAPHRFVSHELLAGAAFALAAVGLIRRFVRER